MGGFVFHSTRYEYLDRQQQRQGNERWSLLYRSSASFDRGHRALSLEQQKEDVTMLHLVTHEKKKKKKTKLFQLGLYSNTEFEFFRAYIALSATKNTFRCQAVTDAIVSCCITTFSCARHSLAWTFKKKKEKKLGRLNFLLIMNLAKHRSSLTAFLLLFEKKKKKKGRNVEQERQSCRGTVQARV